MMNISMNLFEFGLVVQQMLFEELFFYLWGHLVQEESFT